MTIAATISSADAVYLLRDALCRLPAWPSRICLWHAYFPRRRTAAPQSAQNHVACLDSRRRAEGYCREPGRNFTERCLPTSWLPSPITALHDLKRYAILGATFVTATQAALGTAMPMLTLAFRPPSRLLRRLALPRGEHDDSGCGFGIA